MLPAEWGVKSDCWNESAHLKQPGTKPNSKVHRNAVELWAVSFVTGRQMWLCWSLGGGAGLQRGIAAWKDSSEFDGIGKPQASSTSVVDM